jgi:hypothetical protein
MALFCYPGAVWRKLRRFVEALGADAVQGGTQ